MYTKGDKADDILRSFKLSDKDKKKYAVVKFEVHFVNHRNLILERAKFNMRKQDGESVDSFITDLYALTEHCKYNTLHDKMIRDRLVGGLQDTSLSVRC